jgi:peptide/nickel transport system permease protein
MKRRDINRIIKRNNNTVIRSSLMKRNLQKFLSNRLAIVGISIVVILVFASVFAFLFTKYDPSFVNTEERLLPISFQHLLGTDNIGRDIFTRLLYGGRISIFIGIVSALGASLIGIILGCYSGYIGGKVDGVILYFWEIVSAFPQTILVLILVGFAGQGLKNLIIIFSITGWTGIYRVVRSRILSIREESFVECCRANGISNASIMFKHMLPNTLGPVIVTVTLQSAGYVLAEAGLSFIGLGVESSIPTWGNILNAAKSLLVIQNYPAMWIAPGIAISLFVLGVNFFGDGLRDVFDPNQ